MSDQAASDHVEAVTVVVQPAEGVDQRAGVAQVGVLEDGLQVALGEGLVEDVAGHVADAFKGEGRGHDEADRLAGEVVGTRVALTPQAMTWVNSPTTPAGLPRG